MTRASLLVPVLALAALSTGQTEPKKPQTVDVQLPPALTLPTDVQPIKLSSDEAVAVALEKSPVLLAAKANVLLASGKEQQAKSGLVPNVAVTSGFNHVESFGGSSTSGSSGGTSTNPSGYNSAVTLRQLVFDFEKTVNAARQAKLLERVASGLLSQTQLDVAYTVKQAYFGLGEAQRVTSVSEANVTSVGLQLELAKARLESGLGAPVDVVRATTSYDSAVQSLVIARTTEVAAMITLANVIGVDPRTPIAADDTPEADLAHDSLESLVQTALQARPDLLAAKFNVQAADAGFLSSKSSSSPSLSLSVGVNARGDTNPFDTRTGIAGLNVSWPVGDGGLARGLMDQARAGQQSAKATLQQTQLNVVTDVSNAYVQLQAADQRVKVADAEVANAQENIRLAEGRYKAGIGIFLEVSDAQSALVLAQTNQVLAASALNRARAALRRATGQRP